MPPGARSPGRTIEVPDRAGPRYPGTVTPLVRAPRLVRNAIAFAAATLIAAGCSPTAPPLTNRGSLFMDGGGGRASLGAIGPGSPLLLERSPFTISAWFRQEDGGDPYQRIIDKSDGRVGRNGWALGADGASGQIHLYAHDGAHGADFTSTRGIYDVGRWHHVVAVARRDRYEIWVDGRRDPGSFFEEGVFTLPGGAVTEATIGNWNHEPGRAFKGVLDEVAVWSADLVEGEIAEIHAARGTLDLSARGRRYRSAAHLAGWWRMEPDGDAGLTGILKDASGRGRHATLLPGSGGEGVPTLIAAEGL